MSSKERRTQEARGASQGARDQEFLGRAKNKEPMEIKAIAAGPPINGFPITIMAATQRTALATNTATSCPRRTRISVCATRESPFGRIVSTPVIPVNTFSMAKM